MKKYYPIKGPTYVARKLGKTFSSVLAKAMRMGLRRKDFRKWSEWEIRYLKRNYRKKTARSIARTLKRSMDAIHIKAKHLHLIQPPAPAWTEEEKKLLIELFPNPNYSIAEIAQRLGRPEKGITKQARKLRLKRKFFWTKEEHRFLARNYSRMTLREIARHLGKTERSVQHYANRHNFRRQFQKTWTEQEIEYLKQYGGSKTAREIAQTLGRTVHSVRSKLRSLVQAAKSNITASQNETVT